LDAGVILLDAGAIFEAGAILEADRGLPLKDSFARLKQAPQRLEDWVTAVQPSSQRGQLPHYIPKLATADASTVTIAIHTDQGDCWTAGAAPTAFTLMSVMKPFLLLFLLEEFGAAAVFDRVGTQPSDQPFYSLKQLAADRGFPRNPMINSGAITLANWLPGQSGAQKCETLRQWLNCSAGVNLTHDRTMLDSVRSLPNDSNRAIAQVLQQSAAIADLELALDAYNRLCCLSLDVVDLARLGLLLTHHGLATMQRQSQKIVNAMMLSCGLYEASADWAMRIGLPVKSGVSGGILAIVPDQGAIGIYAPAIDDIGNSVAGALLLERIVHELDLSLF
jgi:glutaminase